MKTITFKNKFGYMLGDLANNVTFAMSAGFLLAFYTDVLGISAAAVGTLFLVARLWDGINDPMMGALTDKMFKRRAKKHEGKQVDKFKPYLLYGSFLVVFAGIIMFFSPPGMSTVQKLIWAYVTYILWGMAYTFVNIPYGSLAAVMTQDPVERSALSVSRGLGGMVGNILPRVIVPVLLGMFADNEARGYLIAMAVMGVVAIASYLTTYFTVKENVVTSTAKAHEPLHFKESFKVLVKNKPFIAISIATIAMLTGMMVNQAVSVYYFKDNLQAIEMMSLLGVTSLLPMLIISPVLSKVVKKIGTKKTVSYSSLIAGFFFLLILFLPDNAYIFIGITMMASIFNVVPNMLIWGMVSDSIDYNEYLSGQRQEGVIYGSYSFVRKAGQAIAGFIAGQGLFLVSYNPDLVTQTDMTLFGIKFLTVGLSAIGMFIAFLAFKFLWNLTPERHAEIIEEINARG